MIMYFLFMPTGNVSNATKKPQPKITEELELHNLGGGPYEPSNEAGGIWMGEDLHSVEEEDHKKRTKKRMPRNKVDIGLTQVSYLNLFNLI